MATTSNHLPFHLVLASTSPRRISLLREVGLSFQTVSPDTDEKPGRGESPSSLVKRLAREKAASVLGNPSLIRLEGPVVVLSADTIVVAPDRRTILGKPKSHKEAKSMLALLAGKEHSVLTGYCLMHFSGSTSEELVRVVRSSVVMRKLSKTSIDRYVATGEPLDKAGSYGAQGMGMALIESLRGSYTNVVGLPITQVLQDMETLLELPLFAWIDKK